MLFPDLFRGNVKLEFFDIKLSISYDKRGNTNL